MSKFTDHWEPSDADHYHPHWMRIAVEGGWIVSYVKHYHPAWWFLWVRKKLAKLALRCDWRGPASWIMRSRKSFCQYEG